MEELLLLSLSNTNGRQQAEEQLIEMRDNNTAEYIENLKSVFTNNGNSRAAQFALVLLDQVFSISTTSDLGLELYKEMVVFTTENLSHPNDGIAHASASLLGTCAGAILRGQTDPDLQYYIASLLAPDREERALHNAITAVYSMQGKSPLEPFQVEPIIEALFGLVSIEPLVPDIIQCFANMSEDLSSSLQKEQLKQMFIDFLSQILAEDSLKAQSYLLLYRLTHDCFGFIEDVLNTLLGQIVSDLNSIEDDNILTYICEIIIKISKRQRKEGTQILSFEFFDAVIERLYQICISHYCEDIQSPETFNSFDSASRAIPALSKLFEEHSLKILPDIINQLSSEEEAPGIELHILTLETFKLIGGEIPFDETLELIASRIQTEHPRIRHIALEFLDNMIVSSINEVRKIEQSGADNETDIDLSKFLEFIPTLNEIIESESVVPDVTKYVAMYGLIRLCPIEGAPSIDILSVVVSLLSSADIMVRSNAIDMLIAHFDDDNNLNLVSEASSILELFIQQIEEIETSDDEMVEDLFVVLTLLLKSAALASVPFAEHLLQLLIESESPSALQPLSLLIKYVGNDFEQFAEDIIGFVLPFVESSANEELHSLYVSNVVSQLMEFSYGQQYAQSLAERLLAKIADPDVIDTAKFHLMQALSSCIPYDDAQDIVVQSIIQSAQDYISNFEYSPVALGFLSCIGSTIESHHDMLGELLYFVESFLNLIQPFAAKDEEACFESSFILSSIHAIDPVSFDNLLENHSCVIEIIKAAKIFDSTEEYYYELLPNEEANVEEDMEEELFE